MLRGIQNKRHKKRKQEEEEENEKNVNDKLFAMTLN